MQLSDIRVLVACEYSGIVRDAFARLGCYAISCDLLPSDQPGNHYQGDVFDIINDGFDLMVAHPPCIYLSSCFGSYARFSDRVFKRLQAAEFFMKLYSSDIPYICIENPRGVMSALFCQWDQEVYPYYFGDPWKKRTCLWLKNLPLLRFTGNVVEPGYSLTDKYNDSYRRSRFSPAIAEQMAVQWTDFILENNC
ncbi:MAG: hypothetical protein LBL58_18490 [Tannerellaceae bacterium]|jgi:hypothetical protein|nr:hypothetical protein [Tannerellaceae bacterium]